MARSLNRVQLIGNLTRDPELRYTPNGTAVCSFGLATSRSWTTDAGEKREETEFHRIVSWNKLAELCSQFLVKGRKVYVEGRLASRSWTAQDGTQKTTTEIVIDNMILLDPRRMEQGEVAVKEEAKEEVKEEVKEAGSKKLIDKKPREDKVQKKSEEKLEKGEDSPDAEESISADDIPF